MAWGIGGLVLTGDTQTARGETHVDVNARTMKPIATIVGGSAVAVAAIAAAVLQGSAASGSFAGDMSTGVTITATNPPSAAPVSAAPEIRGPAPLPVEEQGLPG
jgi:hypothetical protein